MLLVVESRMVGLQPFDAARNVPVRFRLERRLDFATSREQFPADGDAGCRVHLPASGTTRPRTPRPPAGRESGNRYLVLPAGNLRRRQPMPGISRLSSAIAHSASVGFGSAATGIGMGSNNAVCRNGGARRARAETDLKSMYPASAGMDARRGRPRQPRFPQPRRTGDRAARITNVVQARSIPFLASTRNAASAMVRTFRSSTQLMLYMFDPYNLAPTSARSGSTASAALLIVAAFN